jgi:signal transduction histidine kinase
MYKRLIILSAIMAFAIGGLALLGYHSISIWADGLEGARLAEFAEVAEQIREDVKLKLDNFMQQEQNRPYTDYQYYSVPEVPANTQQQLSLVVSPLAGRIENDLAFGNFEIEPDGSLVTPYYSSQQAEGTGELAVKAQAHIDNIKRNLLPKLGTDTITSIETWRKLTPSPPVREEETGKKEVLNAPSDKLQFEAKDTKSRRAKYDIESLQQQQQQVQVIEQQREVAVSNVAYRTSVGQQQAADGSSSSEQAKDKLPSASVSGGAQISEPLSTRYAGTENSNSALSVQAAEKEQLEGLDLNRTRQQLGAIDEYGATRGIPPRKDTVQIRIEPFAPIVVPGGSEDSIFPGQVFLLRHVQIGNEHLLQGFQLNEKRLIEEVHDSASRFVREGMDFSLNKAEQPNATYSAILDFGFGEVTLNLMEIDPGWITSQITKLRAWYFTIVTVVFIAMGLVIFSLWRAMRAQVKFAEQKDDFISAVSHELRTPLTSIRMYAEMLEKDWVKSKDKAQEYYRGMRQESERLSRLIENVLDFSRIQKGRKKYSFVLGNLNECVTNVVEVIRSYASEAGFTIKLELGKIEPLTFDADAVTQIVVNLLDNAVKYARNAEDKTITVRTQSQGRFVVIEVEDHGPGIPHKQRDKVFDVFYRCEAEATRQTKGTGLGLALVSKFAQAHNGFVQILTAKPHGAILRVGLAVQP